MSADGPSPAALTYSQDGPVAWITLENSARMNAMTSAMWKALPEMVAKAAADPSVRVVVLRGAGDKAFSAGADISEFGSARTGAAAKDYDALNEAAFQALMNCPKPVIAMIHGYCMGGGLAIALCCDLRLSDEAGQFAIPAAKLGIGYNARWVRPILAALPPARAKEMLFTGQRYRATAAFTMGLINRVVPAADLEAATRTLALEIASNAPLSVAAAKRTIDEIMRHPEAPDLLTLDRLVEACFQSEDYAEGQRAFLEKRKPVFKGK